MGNNNKDDKSLRVNFSHQSSNKKNTQLKELMKQTINSPNKNSEQSKGGD